MIKIRGNPRQRCHRTGKKTVGLEPTPLERRLNDLPSPGKGYLGEPKGIVLPIVWGEGAGNLFVEPPLVGHTVVFYQILIKSKSWAQASELVGDFARRLIAKPRRSCS